MTETVFSKVNPEIIKQMEKNWGELSSESRELVSKVVLDGEPKEYYRGFIEAATLILNAVSVKVDLTGIDIVGFLYCFVTRCYLLGVQAKTVEPATGEVDDDTPPAPKGYVM